MKTTKKILLALFILFSSLTTSITLAASLDKIVAIVNDDVVMSSELDQKVAMFKHEMEHNNMPIPSDAALRQQVLDSIIDLDLQLQIAKKANLEISEQDLNAAISNIAKQNKMSLSQFQTVLSQNNIPYNDFRKQIQNQMLANRVAQQLVSKDITISDEEISKYLKAHKMGNSQQAKHNATEAIFRQKFGPALKIWTKELRKTAYIKIMP